MFALFEFTSAEYDGRVAFANKDIVSKEVENCSWVREDEKNFESVEFNGVSEGIELDGISEGVWSDSINEDVRVMRSNAFVKLIDRDARIFGACNSFCNAEGNDVVDVA